MLTRPWIAVLLLINYLLVVGAGCVNRPGDQHELILVQTSADDYAFQQCRYLRMDGLEAFLNEALATRHQNTDNARHHLLLVIGGVDTHYLSVLTWPLFAPVSPVTIAPVSNCHLAVSAGTNWSVYPPPRLG